MEKEKKELTRSSDTVQFPSIKDEGPGFLLVPSEGVSEDGGEPSRSAPPVSWLGASSPRLHQRVAIPLSVPKHKEMEIRKLNE